jgi:hypothetical protein
MSVCKTCGEPLVAMGRGIERTLTGYAIGACGAPHDDNCLTRAAWCARLHVNWLSVVRRCSACEWIGKRHCNVCGTDKLDAWPDLPIGKPTASVIVHPDDVSMVVKP